MAPITIEAATEAEREWCAQLMARSDPWITLGRDVAQCRARCGDPEDLLLVAHAGPEPCGFILIDLRGVAGSPYVATIAVAEHARGQGVGTLMLAHAESLFAGRARYIFLCVSSFNVHARRLYERLGYSLVGEFKDYVIDGASELLMHKRLVRS